ncbi:DUF1824 family protein [Pleurocapsales cyanobacterium LEGE 06147]|nr:DUF1824 family protein [Pleurocapsales cyanobacterium LEGE 06147]
MSSQKTTDLTVDRALKILKKYSCSENKTVNSELEKDQLRQALLLIVGLSEWENIGICASNEREGFTALKSYLQAFGYDANFKIEEKVNDREPIYIKFNTQTRSHYLVSYTGKYRGVLISCQVEDDELVGTYGHFPLDLFQ